MKLFLRKIYVLVRLKHNFNFQFKFSLLIHINIKYMYVHIYTIIYMSILVSNGSERIPVLLEIFGFKASHVIKKFFFQFLIRKYDTFSCFMLHIFNKFYVQKHCQMSSRFKSNILSVATRSCIPFGELLVLDDGK